MYLNLANTAENNILIYGGAENTSAGEIQMKEIYQLFDNTDKNLNN